MADQVQLFVYGTLQRGEVAHHLLEGARRVGIDRTPPRFRLVDCGWYPALVAGGDRAIEGEVYQIDPSLLPTLDEFEDVPHEYQRETVELERFGAALVYVMRPERAEGRAPIENNRWSSAQAPREP